MRFRISHAPSEEDRILASHLDRAIRELEEAADFVRSTKASKESRTLGIHRDLRRCIVGLRNLETLVPKREFQADADSISEDELAKRARDRYAQKKAARTSGPKGSVTNE